MIRFCQNLLTASIHGSVVILAVMLLRLLLKRHYYTWYCPLRNRVEKRLKKKP